MSYPSSGRPARWLTDLHRNIKELERLEAMTEASVRALAERHGISRDEAQTALASSYEEMRVLEGRIAMAQGIRAGSLPTVTRPADLGHVLLAARRIMNESQEMFASRFGMNRQAFASSERRCHDGMRLARLDEAFEALGMRIRADPVMGGEDPGNG